MPGKVYAIAMSAMATTHMLVAAGTEDVRVRLCDLASGACTHTLSGHRGTWAFFLKMRLWNVDFVDIKILPVMHLYNQFC